MRHAHCIGHSSHQLANHQLHPSTALEGLAQATPRARGATLAFVTINSVYYDVRHALGSEPHLLCFIAVIKC